MSRKPRFVANIFTYILQTIRLILIVSMFVYTIKLFFELDAPADNGVFYIIIFALIGLVFFAAQNILYLINGYKKFSATNASTKPIQKEINGRGLD